MSERSRLMIGPDNCRAANEKRNASIHPTFDAAAQVGPVVRVSGTPISYGRTAVILAETESGKHQFAGVFDRSLTYSQAPYFRVLFAAIVHRRLLAIGASHVLC